MPCLGCGSETEGREAGNAGLVHEPCKFKKKVDSKGEYSLALKRVSEGGVLECKQPKESFHHDGRMQKTGRSAARVGRRKG